MPTDWDKIRSDYEVLGLDLNELAETYQVDIGILEMAVDTQSWTSPDDHQSVPTTDPMVVDDKSEKAIEAHHRTVLPKYMAVELQFLNKLSSLINGIINADEAKKIAETLAAIKPQIMKSGDEGAGGLKILVQNQFPVPQPGDENFIPANAVILGDAARQGIDMNQIAGTDYTTLEIDTEDYIH